MATFIVRGSHGELEVDGTSGLVVARAKPDAYRAIVRFHLEEWCRTHGQTTPVAAGTIDILDLGYWTGAGQYEPPAFDFRQSLALDP